MNYIPVSLAILFLFLQPVAVCRAQADAMAAIQKIYAAYNTANTVSFQGSMKMYAKSNPAKIIEQMKSSYLLRGKNFICTIGPVEMLLNDNYYVSADRADKLIVIGYTKNLSETAQLPVLNIEQFKRWVDEKIFTATVIPQGATSLLQLNDVQGVTGYHLYRIEYNAISGYMAKVVLEAADYNDAARKTMVLEINYTVPVIKKVHNNTFSEKHFFSLVNNKIRVTGNYTGYQLINQL